MYIDPDEKQLPVEIASDEEVKEVSDKLLEENKVAYEALSK